MPRPRPLSPFEAKRTLAARFGPRADRLRQLATKFGIRPYRVFIVHTRATGDERGEGVEEEVSRFEILPTPVVKSLDSVALSPTMAGILPVGSLRVSRVSTTISNDRLNGVLEDTDPDPKVSFFYEVVEDGRLDNPAVRRKFRLASNPHLTPGNVEWQFVLERISEDRGRNGKDVPLP